MLHDSPVPETLPWWARPTDFVGWKYRIGLFLLVCLAIVWTARKLDRTVAILVGVIALGVALLVTWLRARDEEL